jgi:hypothetical protein
MRAKIQKISRYAPSIFQGRLELSSPRHRHAFSLTAEHPAEPHTFRVLLALLGVLGCVYVYFVGASVLNVISRKEALAETAQLANAVSRLERDYFALSQGVGPEDGARLGLSPISKTEYVYRPGNAAAAEPRNDL